MAVQASGKGWSSGLRAIDKRTFVRLTLWGAAAAIALLAAVTSILLSGEAPRNAAGIGPMAQRAPLNIVPPGATKPTSVPPTTVSQGQGPLVLDAIELASRAAKTESELRQLTDTVRALNVDRDHVLNRIAALERSFDEMSDYLKAQITSSIPAVVPPNKAAQNESPRQPATPPVMAREELPDLGLQQSPSPSGVAAQARQASTVATTTSEPIVTEPFATKSEFGIDIGGAVNFEGLRVLWNSTQANHGEQVEGLYPLVVVRENPKAKSVELRLVVGPLTTPDAAARICSSLLVARRYCLPVAFEGQRLQGIELTADRRSTGTAAPAAAQKRSIAVRPARPVP
jgi:hypothetical protein